MTRAGSRFFAALAQLASALLSAGCGRSPEARPVEDAPREAADVAFVHLFEWRWADVAMECESYLGPAGFSAVQISPPNEHAVLPGHPWWQRYQAVSHRLDRSRSGTLEEFRDMVSRCRRAGVDVYADALVNHMTAQASGIGSNGTSYTKYDYPGLFGAEDFHAPACVIAGSDYADQPQRVRNCELLGLADLNTSKQTVRERIALYLARLVELGVRGFRIDAAKHIAPDDLTAILQMVDDRVGPAAPYYFLEVIDHGTEAIRAADYLAVGSSRARAVDVTEFKYAAIGGAFLGKNGAVLADLRPLADAPHDWLPSDQAVVFTTNHDTERADAVYYADGAALDLATVFALAWPYGYPSILSSYAFDRSTQAGRDSGPPADDSGTTLAVHPSGAATPDCVTDPTTTVGSRGWLCQHRRPYVEGMIGFRKATAGAALVTRFWDDGANQIAFGRGDRGFVVINLGAAVLSRAFETDLPPGHYCDVVRGFARDGKCTEPTVVVAEKGVARFDVPASSAVAIHVEAVASR